MSSEGDKGNTIERTHTMETFNKYKDNHGRLWVGINYKEFTAEQFESFIKEWDELEEKSFAAGCGCDRRGRWDIRGRRTRHGKWMEEQEEKLSWARQIRPAIVR